VLFPEALFCRKQNLSWGPSDGPARQTFLLKIKLCSSNLRIGKSPKLTVPVPT